MNRCKKSNEPEQPNISLEKKEKEAFAISCLRMFEEETLCDVTFVAGVQQERIRAHKFILIARSEVFRAMFCCNYAEASGTVTIPEIHPDNLKILLRYMYTGDFEDPTLDNVFALLYAAEKYQLKGFADMCELFLQKSLCLQFFCPFLNQATLYNKKALRRECLLYASSKGSQILKSNEFLSLTHESLLALVNSDYNKANEDEIFLACIKWATSQCEKKGIDNTPENIRQCLGEILHSIRFTSMDIEAFSSKISIENILTDGEKVALFHSIINKSDDYMKFNFTGAQQRCKSSLYSIVDLGQIKANIHTLKNPCDNIVLKFSKDIMLISISVIVPVENGQTFDGSVHITIKNIESSSLLYDQRQFMANLQKKPDVGRLRIRPIVKLKRNTNYKVSITFEGSDISTREAYGTCNKITGPNNELVMWKEEETVQGSFSVVRYKPFQMTPSSFNSIAAVTIED